ASAPELADALLLWDGQPRRARLPEAVRPANFWCFARDGRTLWGVVRGRNDVVSLHWPELRVRSRWSDTSEGNRGVWCLAAGQKWVLAGSPDLSTKLLRTADSQVERAWPRPGGPVHSVARSADEMLAASGTQAGHVQVVRLPGGEVVQAWQPHRDAVEAVAFHPESRLLATGSKDRTVRLWQREGD